MFLNLSCRHKKKGNLAFQTPPVTKLLKFDYENLLNFLFESTYSSRNNRKQ
jgi:hypothetical protein